MSTEMKKMNLKCHLQIVTIFSKPECIKLSVKHTHIIMLLTRMLSKHYPDLGMVNMKS